MDKKINCPTCPQKTPRENAGGPCRWREPTEAKWSPRPSSVCSTIRCHLPEARQYPGPAFVASGNARVATVDDELSGAPIPGADYIAVRSCYCTARGCQFYTPNKEGK